MAKTIITTGRSSSSSEEDLLKINQQQNINNENSLIVLPGDCLLLHESDIIASTGTYLKDGCIFASIVGKLEIELKKFEENGKIDGNNNN